MLTGARRNLLTGLILAVLSSAAQAAELSPAEGYQLIADLMSSQKKTSKAASKQLIEAGDETLVPGIVDAIFFTPRAMRTNLVSVLQEMTGEKFGSDYKAWLRYVGGREDLRPKPGYVEWKGLLFSRIDDTYRDMFLPGTQTTIRPEEIVWGGVPLDGIPSLENPPAVGPKEARYLQDKELVFGIVVDGVARAYPRRFLSWHEMLNDDLGGEPITISYCTLCGSAVGYYRRTEAGQIRRFGTSGLLYRSNKLMFDHETKTLWSNLTGKPVFGSLVGKAAELRQVPVTLTTWQDWRTTHPETTTLDLPGVKKQFRGKFSFDYLPGAADRARRGVSFPVWLSNDRLDRNAEVFTLRLGTGAKAFPIELVLAEGVVNDSVGGQPVVLVGDAKSGAIRAYARGDKTFSGSVDSLVDGSGMAWRLTEDALASGDSSDENSGASLERIPGHTAFWFGWYAFYPETEVYEGS